MCATNRTQGACIFLFIILDCSSILPLALEAGYYLWLVYFRSILYFKGKTYLLPPLAPARCSEGQNCVLF